LKSAEQVLVYPNPAVNTVTVELENNQIKKPKYEIYNIKGQLVDKGRIKSNVQIIELSTLPEGIYMLNVHDRRGNKMATEKIIKE
jgi:hypothetical protein